MGISGAAGGLTPRKLGEETPFEDRPVTGADGAVDEEQDRRADARDNTEVQRDVARGEVEEAEANKPEYHEHDTFNE